MQLTSQRVWPVRRSAFLVAMLCGTIVAAAGCGGGSSAARLSRKVARERAIASARLTRGDFAIAGVGRHITRSNGSRHSRLASILRAAIGTRDTPPDFDADLGLYTMQQINTDGSGTQQLFADASHNVPAGQFEWLAPVWAGNQKDSYPAGIHTNVLITQGPFAGEHGTIDFTATDPSGDNGTMRLDLTTGQNEHIVADFDFTNGKARARDRCSLPDGTEWSETDIPQDDGGMICTIAYSDGSQETIMTAPDGTSQEILKDADGTVEASGSVSDSGMDDIQFSDGSTENVDVNTADAGDGGGSTDSGGDSNRAAKGAPIGKR